MISSCQRRVHYDLSPAGGNLLDLRAKYFGLQINNVRDIMLSPSPKSYTMLCTTVNRDWLEPFSDSRVGCKTIV